MARKPNSWKEINDLTQNVTLAKKNKKIKPMMIIFIVVIAFAVIAYAAFALISSVLSYGGISTSGLNPDIKENNYITINLADASMHDIKDNEWTNYNSDKVEDHLKLQRDKSGNLISVKSTSLRLEYVYNDLIEEIPFFVVKNDIYKIFYPDRQSIQVVNIFDDLKNRTLLSEKKVLRNQYAAHNFNIYAQINYKNSLQTALIIVPVQLFGLDNFYGTFFKFKLGDFIKKDSSKATIWEQQTSMFGASGSNLSFPTDSSKNDQSINPNDVYSHFKTMFDDFFNYYQSTEFFSKIDDNPYANFVISDVKQKDEFLNYQENNYLDDNDYLLDINSLLDLGSVETNDDKSTDLSSILIFLKNIISFSGDSSSIVASKNWDFTSLASVFSDPNYQQFIKGLKPVTSFQPGDQLYLMFMPKDFQLSTFITSPLMAEMVKVIENKKDLKVFLKQVMQNLLSGTEDPISKEINQWNVLPYEIYDITNTKDFDGSQKLVWLYEKYRAEVNKSLYDQNSSYLIIDRPTLYSLMPKKELYDLSNPQDCHDLINDFLFTIPYSKLHEQDITINWGDSEGEISTKFYNSMKKIVNNLINYCTTNNIKITGSDKNLLLQKEKYTFNSKIYSRVTKKTTSFTDWKNNIEFIREKEQTQNLTTIDYKFHSESETIDNTNNDFIFRFFVKYSNS